MSSDVVEPALPNLAPVTESRAGWQRLMLLPLVILAGMGLSVEAGLLGRWALRSGTCGPP